MEEEEIPITITREEIDAANVHADEEITKEQKIMYHNEVVTTIDKGVRKALKRKDEYALFLSGELGNYPRKEWKVAILKKIVKKYNDKKINVYYDNITDTMRVTF